MCIFYSYELHRRLLSAVIFQVQVHVYIKFLPSQAIEYARALSHMSYLRTQF